MWTGYDLTYIHTGYDLTDHTLNMALHFYHVHFLNGLLFPLCHDNKC